MPRLTIASRATTVKMGAEVYQEAVASRAVEALSAAENSWTVERMIARSMRSRLPGTHRLPMGWLAGAPAGVRRAVGRGIYPPSAVVHRMSLELPPSPHLDVVTLHDVVAWRFSDETDPIRAAAEELRRAAAVICVSSFSAEEAVELLKVERPFVVHNGVDEQFFDAQPLPTEALLQFGIRGPFVLAVGGATRRKNLEGLAAAWSQLHRARPDHYLVLAGPEHPRRAQLFGHLARVRILGRVQDDQMPGLFAAAAAVVVPSLYEGFGLPVLEGMAAGVPVVVADTSALSEVAGNAGLLVAPTASGIAEGLLHATSGDAELAGLVSAGRLRAREFTWDRCAAGHAAVWRAVAA